jgi:predicted transposase/invertase (TIGR01784 family)
MPINYDIKKDAFYKEGREKGKLEEKKDTALRMKKAGFSMADVVKATGLTKAQIEQL